MSNSNEFGNISFDLPKHQSNVIKVIGVGGGGNNIEDEIEVLKSRSNLIDIVKELGINKKIIALGNIQNGELYNNAPFKLNFIAHDSIILNSKG